MSETSININYITASFHTNTDDKDFDTGVQVNISPYQNGAVTEIIATYTGDLGGHLADGSISQPVTLNWFEVDFGQSIHAAGHHRSKWS